jgi:two-component system LytT family sensor kinase
VKYVAVAAGICMLLLDTLLRVAIGIRVPLATLLWNCTAWLLWAILTPVVVRVATAFRYRHGARLRFFLVHGVTMLTLTIAQRSLYVLLRTLVRGTPGRPGQSFLEVVIQGLPPQLMVGLFVSGLTILATQMTFFLQGARRRDEERLALERWLAQAELDLYKLQLPVAVVNERLLEIERTIPRDAERAELLIEQFGAFLRESLAAVNVHADVDEIAHDEDEWEEEPSPAWPLPLRFLLLFSIIPATHLVINAIGVTAGTGNLTLTQAAEVVLLDNARASVVYFPVTLMMVWLGSRVRRIAVLVAVAVVLAFTWHLGVMTVTDGARQARESLEPAGLFLDSLLNFGVALGALAHARYRTWRATAAEVAQLETRVLHTRSALLRLQLNPHFLFNTLNSVAALLEEDTAAAARMAAQLRQFVVRVLESPEGEQVLLAEELESLVAYVAIENVRFAGRVELDIRVDENARCALVPSFLLQPLVENALRHGLMPETGGRISVRAAVLDGTLRIAVDDNGRSNDAEVPARQGLGLSNTRARLAQMFGDDCHLDTVAEQDGFGVALAIPYSVSAA